MIKKIVKLLTNPQGALVSLILDQVTKVFKLDKVLSYVEKPNELDVAMKNVENKCSEIDLKIKAMQGIIKDLDKSEELKDIKKTMDKLKNTKFL